jgi:hypothetical protein
MMQPFGKAVRRSRHSLKLDVIREHLVQILPSALVERVTIQCNQFVECDPVLCVEHAYSFR